MKQELHIPLFGIKSQTHEQLLIIDSKDLPNKNNATTMDINYSKTDLRVSAQYEDEPKYGLHEVTENGITHSTNWDAESNTRTSKDIDSEGNVSGEHSTDQNYPKGDSRRH